MLLTSPLPAVSIHLSNKSLEGSESCKSSVCLVVLLVRQMHYSRADLLLMQLLWNVRAGSGSMRSAAIRHRCGAQYTEPHRRAHGHQKVVVHIALVVGH